MLEGRVMELVLGNQLLDDINTCVHISSLSMVIRNP